jgi:hypothetical protein
MLGGFLYPCVASGHFYLCKDPACLVSWCVLAANYIEHFIVCIANAAPLIKTLTAVAANKLVSLFSVMSLPAYILANEFNHRMLAMIIEAITSLIQYQMPGNINLIYSVLRSNNKFAELFNLDFYEAEEKLEKIRAARRIGSGRSSIAASDDEGSQGTPMSARGRGKQVEEVESEEPQYDETTKKFTPTRGWYDGWKRRLPLAVVLIMIDALAPSIEKMCLDEGLTDESGVLSVLENATLVGILPPPHAIFMRKFMINDSSRVWFLSFAWV